MGPAWHLRHCEQTHNRDKDSNSTNDYTLTYDAVGNMTDDGEKYTYVYDAFGRLVTVKNRSTSVVVAEFEYNGLNHRIGSMLRSADADASGTAALFDLWVVSRAARRVRYASLCN